jgi:transcriptional regulator with XRE-family HTH domain
LLFVFGSQNLNEVKTEKEHLMEREHIEQFGRVTIDREQMASLFRERREVFGLTIRELAAKAGVGATTVHSLEQGNSGVNLETFLRVLAALELLPQHVLKIDETDIAPPPTEREALVARLLREGDHAALLRLLAEQLDSKKDSS